MPRKKEFAPRAVDVIRSRREEEESAMFGGLGPRQPPEGRARGKEADAGSHRVTVVLGDDLYFKMWAHVRRPGSAHKSLSSFLRAAIESALDEEGDL